MLRHITAPVALSHPFTAGTECGRLEKPGREVPEPARTTDTEGAASQH
jgi:hypothetical protein